MSFGVSHPLRVHLSACPSERYLYFDRVCEYIMALDGVELSYSASPIDGEPQFPSDARVLVILASERYFTSKNSGYVSEYLNAKEHSALVIPMLFDGHIVNLLNTRCGKTQYIAVNNNLDNALKLLGDKLMSLTEQIGALSSPGVFISYRKKDRAALLQLLDVISGIEGAKELVVWYDGDITPGDNYEREISSALEGCELFVLLVTPALLEDNNFVMRCEYPYAKQLGKKIIAVEAEKTCRKLLEEKYPDIPKPVNIKQIGAIRSALLKLVENK